MEIDNDLKIERRWKSAVPIVRWLPSYQRQWFPRDAVAGVTLAAYAIPVSLAYATLAGLPPHNGIYCYLFGGLAYAIFGSSRQLAIGPTSAISMLVGISVAEIAGGDADRCVGVAALAALMVALMAVVAWFLRLSTLMSFISETILLGFKAGAAMTIALTQLPKLFGVPGGGEHFFERLRILGTQLPQTNLMVLMFGSVALVLLIGGERLMPGRPVALAVVTLSVVVMSLSSLDEYGLRIVGELPQGLPEFSRPSLRLSDVDGVIPLAFACFLLSYIESVSAARALAVKNGYEVDARQELLGLSAANLVVAFSQGFPVAGGLSQSAVNEKAGAASQVSLLVASASLGLCLMYMTSLLKNLPVVVLASVVLVAVKGLMDVRALTRLYQVSRYEFFISMVALAGVLLLGILKGVLLAAVVSLLMLLSAAAHPHVAFLGRVPGTRRYSEIDRNPENEEIPATVIFRVESSVLYFNCDHVREAVRRRIQRCPDLRLIVCDLSNSPRVDMAAAQMISAMQADLAARGVRLRLAEVSGSARDLLRAMGLQDRIGGISRPLSVDQAVQDAAEEFHES